MLKGDIIKARVPRGILDSTHSIWLAGLGAYAMAQEEGGKMFDTLVKTGRSVEARTRQATEQAYAEVREQAEGTWQRLEQAFERNLSRSLSGLGVPSKKEIEALSKRVAELNAAVDKLSAKRAKAAKPARAPRSAK